MGFLDERSVLILKDPYRLNQFVPEDDSVPAYVLRRLRNTSSSAGIVRKRISQCF